MKILWLSRHAPLAVQVAELRHHFGADLRLSTDIRPFGDGSDIVRRFRAGGYDEMVVVAPLSVLDALCKQGIFPLRADMRTLPDEPSPVDPERHVYASGRWYEHVQFARVVELTLRTVPIATLRPCAGCSQTAATGAFCRRCSDLLGRYVEFSEDTQCASFLSPSPAAVREFRQLPVPVPSVQTGRGTMDYEIKFLVEYFRQEREEEVSS